MHRPTFFGVLPFPFLSRTVDSTFADDFAGVALAVSAPTDVGPVVERSRSGARLTFRGRPCPGCICLNFQTVMGGMWGVGSRSGLCQDPKLWRGRDSLAVELEDSLAVELEDSLAVELEEENWDVEKEVENWDVEKVVKAKRAAGAGPPTPPPSIMTADIGLETQGSAGVEVIGPHATWQFDFGDSFGDSFGGLTDEDTVTSMASKETLAWSSRGDKQEIVRSTWRCST